MDRIFMGFRYQAGESLFLPPASEGGREVMFTQVCVCPTLGEYPIQLTEGAEYPILGPDSEGRGWLPHPRSRWGYPIPGLDGGRGVPPSFLTEGGTCIPGLDGGVPHPADRGLPPLFLMEIPPSEVQMGGTHIPSLDRRYPIKLMGGGTPILPDGGTPSQIWMGYLSY